MPVRPESGSLQIKLGFQFVDRRKVVVLATEELDDFDRCAEGGERIDLEDVERFDALHAAIGKLVEQGIEHGTGLAAVFGEDVALFHFLGAFAAGWRPLLKNPNANHTPN